MGILSLFWKKRQKSPRNRSILWIEPLEESTPVTGPTGYVNFYDGETYIGQGLLEDGIASFTINTLSVGDHEITAVYQTDGIFESGTSDLLTETILANQVTVTLTSSVNSAYFSQNVTFSATVSPNGTPVTGPTGYVNFYDGETYIGQGLLQDGVASFAIDSLAVGDHDITAVYQGDGTFELETSLVLTQTILEI